MKRKEIVDNCLKNHEDKSTTVLLSNCSYNVCATCANEIRNLS